ncbi:hypothetical protein KCU65_g321, partial [Aureobasidium melanogenum]
MSTPSVNFAKCPARYPYLQNSYNNAMLSDVVLCFGGERVFAHKITLMAASEVFHAAFNSKFPVADQGTFEIKGHSTSAVYAMLRHIYSKPLEGPAPAREFAEELDHHFAVFLIGNEYEAESLCQYSAQSIAQMIKSIPITKPVSRWCPEKSSPSRLQLLQILEKTATLYIDSKIADTSLLDAVIQTYLDIFPGLSWLDRNLGLSDMLERMDVFSPRLIRASLGVKPLFLEAYYE